VTRAVDANGVVPYWKWLNRRWRDAAIEIIDMAIYKLTPLNPTDSIWLQFPFVETVWTNARDEREARIRVSEVAYKMSPGLLGPMNYWPWVYFARCTADETKFSIARGYVVDSLGRVVADPLYGTVLRHLAQLLLSREPSELATSPKSDWDASLEKITLARGQFAALAHERVTTKDEEPLNSHNARLAQAAQPTRAKVVSHRRPQGQRRGLDAA
jgi:hypothetical protein